MNLMKGDEFIVNLEQIAHCGTADTITMHVVSAPTAIQVKMSIDFMNFVSTQQRTSESVTVLKMGWTELIFPDMLTLLAEIKQTQFDQIFIHYSMIDLF